MLLIDLAISDTGPESIVWRRYLPCKGHNKPHRLSNQKNFVYLAEIGD